MAIVPKKQRLEETLKVRIDPEMKARLQAVVEKTGQKVAAVARIAMETGLDAIEAEAKKKK